MTDNTKTIIGMPVGRVEDPQLIIGQGRYVDDIHLPGMLAACFVRSPFAHAEIRGIETSAAREFPGVVAVYTHADIAPHLTTDLLTDGLPTKAFNQIVDRQVLASKEVCHVGEVVAVVIAESRYLAEDAAELIEVDYDPLPVVADPKAALEPGAPTVHKDAADNLVGGFEMGHGDTDAAFARADHVFSESIFQHKGCGQAIECRGMVAMIDPVSDRLNMWTSTQMPHGAKRMLVRLLGCDEDDVAVITPDIGGGFGPKLVFYPEEMVLAVATRLVGKPIKWIEDRREHFTGTTQERDQYWEVEAAVDKDGMLLGVRGSMIHDHGAYTARGLNLPYNAASNLPGPYIMESFKFDVKLALTNKVSVTPVRGAGHPQGTFAMERLMDRIGDGLGIDRAEIRRRNMVPADQMPYTRELKTRGGKNIILDSGDYPGCLKIGLAAADYAGFKTRQADAARQGRYLGMGIACYIKGTGRGPFEAANVRIGPSGRISLYTGATAIGQGTRTMLAQIVADSFGADVKDIRVVTGDTTTIAIGIGASASRQAVTAGSSAHVASQEVREKVLNIAAHILEASEEDLDIADGKVSVRGVPGMEVSLADVAAATAGTAGYALPGGVTPGLEADAAEIFDEMTYSGGTHVVEVEVDIDTGAVEILQYKITSDCGRMINPMIVDGQMVGGAAHGIGTSLYEHIIYDDQAQPQTTTLAEYLMPTATQIPQIDIIHNDFPTPLNPLGIKGVGESGVIPAPAAIISAVENALADFNVQIAESPISPQRIVELVANGRAG
jgi:aerobic carbon-monoxide dehydrogenase large subunit